MKRLIEQESCEHGKFESHQLPVYRHDSCGYWKCSKCSVCPGGSSREVTVDFWEAVYDYMVKEFSIDDMLDREMFQVHTYDLERAALGGGR